MAFMSSKIYPLNKLCRALPAEFMVLDTRSAYQCRVWMFGRGPQYFHRKEAWNISIILKGFRILGRNWVSFSKMVHSKAIDFPLTWNSAAWKDCWQPGSLLLWMENDKNDKRRGCRSGRTFLIVKICQCPLQLVSQFLHIFRYAFNEARTGNFSKWCFAKITRQLD